jgi:hypothetical protein
MLRRTSVLVFVLAAALLMALPSPSAAAPSPRAPGLWGQVWGWLAAAIPGLEGPRWSRGGGATSTTPAWRAIWGEEGGAIDPNGKASAATNPTSTSGH